MMNHFISLLISLLANMLSGWFMERVPALTRWLLARAVRRMPVEQRERWDREWSADVAEELRDGRRHSALATALGVYLIQGRRITATMTMRQWKTRVSTRWVGLTLRDFAPLASGFVAALMFLNGLVNSDFMQVLLGSFIATSIIDSIFMVLRRARRARRFDDSDQ